MLCCEECGKNTFFQWQSPCSFVNTAFSTRDTVSTLKMSTFFIIVTIMSNKNLRISRYKEQNKESNTGSLIRALFRLALL